MLSLSLIGHHQESYYTELASEDYYTEGGEPPGQWRGEGAARLGLTGSVSKEDLRYLMRGFDPEGQRLVRNAGRPTRRAGFDLTFNAEKSVSVLFSQVDTETREVVREAQATAVRAALEYLERVAGEVRRGIDGLESERAGLVVATYEHSAARIVTGATVPDPHLHTHCLLINVGVTSDGRSATLDSALIYKHKMAAGGIYRAELMKGLRTRLGLRLERRGRFAALRDVPKELCDELSKRRFSIEEALLSRGLVGTARERERAALMTRSPKPRVERARYIEAWQQEGQRHGFDPRRIFGLEQTVAAAPERTEYAVRCAVERAVQRITASQSHFAARELVAASAEELEASGVGAAAVLEGVGRHLTGPEIVAVGKTNREARYTTQEMLKLEARLLESAQELVARSARLERDTLDTVLAKRPTMTEEQRRAFFHVTHGQALSLVRGLAGTGKTFLLDAAREAIEAQGMRVVGCALAAAAAKRLQEGSKIKSSTIHQVLNEMESGRLKLDPKSVVVVDEAGMVGTRQLERLVALVGEARARLVLVGDDRQLQAIEAGAPFASMARRFGAAELTSIQRQREAWARDAVGEFSRGEADGALKRYAARGLLVCAPTKCGAIMNLVNDWFDDVGACGARETLILTSTRSDACILNRCIQHERQRRGELGASVAIGDDEFHLGERVVFRRNARRLGVLNGDCGEVVAVEADRMTVRLDGGTRVTIHHAVVAETRPTLGYAATTHASQGATVERCLVLVGGSMQDREATYVQASRARGTTRLYVDEATAGGELEELTRLMQRSRAKDLAHDVLESAPVNPTGGEGPELSLAA